MRSRILNLNELNPAITQDSLNESLIESFLKVNDQPHHTLEDLDMTYLNGNKQFLERYEAYKDWNWRFGKTPDFAHNLEKRFDWGIMVCWKDPGRN